MTPSIQKKMDTLVYKEQPNFTVSTNGEFYFKVKHYDLNNNYTHYTWKQINSLSFYSLFYSH